VGGGIGRIALGQSGRLDLGIGTSPAATAKAAAAPPAAAHHFSPLDAAPEYAPEIPVRSDADERPPSHESVPATHRPDPLLSERSDPPEDQEILPSISELNLTGAQALPELHLDVHVYATKPSERFVYINMRKYHEGSVLQEGPKVERIRRDGVVLDYKGLRFILPRQP
jgi:general secretion pathway protein B